jgi:hypothetical protein
MEPEQQIEVKGRDLVTSIPQNIIITSEEVRKAVSGHVDSIVQAVRTTLAELPPEFAADIMDRGIALTGGGALLKGLDQLLREETSLPINVVMSVEKDKKKTHQGAAALAFWSMPKELKTPEFFLAAVQQNGWTLELVPEALKTPEMCLAAVQNTLLAFEDVPRALQTPEFCLVAVQKYCMRQKALKNALVLEPINK